MEYKKLLNNTYRNKNTKKQIIKFYIVDVVIDNYRLFKVIILTRLYI